MVNGAMKFKVWQTLQVSILAPYCFSSNPLQEDIEAVVDFSDPVVDSHMNSFLCAPFNEAEVRRAVFDIQPSKAPGPDGITALFYQKFCPVVGSDISEAVLSILNGQRDVKDWNTTLMTLIPKVKDPICLKYFRPM